MDQDDVVTPHQRQEFLGVACQHALVVIALLLTKLATVSRRPVQPVVNPLGDREECRVPLDDQPPRVDAGAADIGQQRLEHLRHAAAGRG
jgi:hypothetical protein